jgi:hypothetical protein
VTSNALQRFRDPWRKLTAIILMYAFVASISTFVFFDLFIAVAVINYIDNIIIGYVFGIIILIIGIICIVSAIVIRNIMTTDDPMTIMIRKRLPKLFLLIILGTIKYVYSTYIYAASVIRRKA